MLDQHPFVGMEKGAFLSAAIDLDEPLASEMRAGSAKTLLRCLGGVRLRLCVPAAKADARDCWRVLEHAQSMRVKVASAQSSFAW